VRPELSGGGAPTTTYREAKQRKDQALAQLAPQAQSMRDCAEDLARILVILRSKYGSGTVKAQRKGAYGVETDVADMADLQESGWHTESDDQFPLTLADKRDAVYGILKDGFQPEVINTLGVLDPMNAIELTELLGIEGFQSSVVEQIEKTLSDVDKLLQGAPLPAQPGPDGKPGVPMPSVPVDAFDDHVLVDQFLARWLRGPAGQKHVNTPGFTNVQLFWQGQHELATPPAPPPPPLVKGSLAMSLKGEDMPALVPAMMEAAGIHAPTPPPPAAPAVRPGAPPPMLNPDSGPVPDGAQINGIPHLPVTPTGPPPVPLQ